MMSTNDLSSLSQSEFERAYRKLSESPPALAALLAAAVSISTSGLETREKDRRISLLLAGRNFEKAEVELIVQVFRAGEPVLRQALVNALPPEQRRALYNQEVGDPVSVSVTETETIEPEPKPHELREEIRTVLLLGTNNHESNSNLLRTGRFTPITIHRPEQFETLLLSEGPIAGFVVDGSWWRLLPEADHEGFLKRLFNYSTFAFIKIDATSLSSKVAGSLHRVCAESRFRTPQFTELKDGSSAQLVPSDLHALEEAARNLAAYTDIRLYPADITGQESLIVLAALQKRRAGQHSFRPVQIQRVGASFIAGGRSEAKVILLKSDNGGPPLVAKVASVSALQEEMRRFKTFIQDWEDRVRPELYVQGATAAILFDLLDGDGNLLTPAPTLGDRLRELESAERGAPSTNPDLLKDLKHVITSTAKRLASLNSRPCASPSIPSLSWVTTEPLDQLEANGVCYEITDGANSLNFKEHLAKAQSQIAKLKEKATVHGDVHLGNILVRNDREPAFIDFAFSGPGHPCFDLVRLEAAIVYPHLRLLGGEDLLTDIFVSVLQDELTEDQVIQNYPTFFSSRVSLLALHASLSVKSEAKRLLKHFHGDISDFFALKLIVACQCLALPSSNQTAVVRAAIRATLRILNV